VSRTDLEIYRADVVRTAVLSPGLIRVVFGGAGLAGFRSTGVGDEHLQVFLPDPQTGELRLPRTEGHGWTYPDDVAPAPMRTFTVRGADAVTGEVTVDFVVHDGGVASAWARQVASGETWGRGTAGQVAGLTSPTGLDELPPDAAWQLLVADAAGLPAVSRLLEQAPGTVRTRAVIEVADASHVVPIEAPGVEIVWVFGGNGRGPSRLGDVVREAMPADGPGYLWFAGERAVSREVGRFLRHERGLPSSRYKVADYWAVDAQQRRDADENLDANTKEWLSSMWASGWDEEEIEAGSVTCSA
jgi:NADPH-dependent ferric siderophore reductase